MALVHVAAVQISLVHLLTRMLVGVIMGFSLEECGMIIMHQECQVDIIAEAD